MSNIPHYRKAMRAIRTMSRYPPREWRENLPRIIDIVERLLDEMVKHEKEQALKKKPAS